MYKKCTAEPYSVLVNDNTLTSDNPLRFINFFLHILKIMTINDQINREAAKILAL